MIHETAVVDPKAALDEGVHVGPYSVIGEGVEVGAGTSIGAHVVVKGRTRIGRDNRIVQFNSIGDDPQDKKYAGEVSRLEIGDRNVIREFCTFNRGTAGGGGVTRIGSGNWIMAYVHVAHDCTVGDGVTLANGVQLAGHVRVEDHVTLGALTVVHQFCAIGRHAFSAMGTVVFKDVPPFVLVAGNSARAKGLNSEGLRRRGVSPAVMRALKDAYKSVYRSGLTVEEALEALVAHDVDEVRAMASFLRGSTRGIVR
jgi:UDP-N-acetylglucosamine acyltransferase